VIFLYKLTSLFLAYSPIRHSIRKSILLVKTIVKTKRTPHQVFED